MYHDLSSSWYLYVLENFNCRASHQFPFCTNCNLQPCVRYCDTIDLLFSIFRIKSNVILYAIISFRYDKMIPKSNHTLDMKDEERHFWTAYNLTICLFSFIGNTVILIVTTKNTSFKLHRVIVVILQHLAVNNLLFSVFKVVIPELTRDTSDHVILGDILCFIQDHVNWIYCPLAGSLTCALLVAKLLMIRSPLRPRNWSSRCAHSVCALVWVFVIYLCVQSGPVFSNSACANQHTKLPKVVWREKSDFIQSVCFVVLASTMILTSVLIPFKVRRRTEHQLRWQSLLGVTLLTTTYLLSFLPWFTDNVTRHSDYSPPLLHAIKYLRNMNVISIIIYCLLEKSFREFLKVKLRTLTSYVGRRRFSGLSGSREFVLEDS